MAAGERGKRRREKRGLDVAARDNGGRSSLQGRGVGKGGLAADALLRTKPENSAYSGAGRTSILLPWDLVKLIAQACPSGHSLCSQLVFHAEKAKLLILNSLHGGSLKKQKKV